MGVFRDLDNDELIDEALIADPLWRKTVSVHRRSEASHLEVEPDLRCRGFSIMRFEGSCWRFAADAVGYGESKGMRVDVVSGLFASVVEDRWR